MIGDPAQVARETLARIRDIFRAAEGHGDTVKRDQQVASVAMAALERIAAG